MKINSINLSAMTVRRSQFPKDNLAEYLLVGRSNVGKSSFINSLAHRKNYARTSSRPGKTQTINFYNVDDKFYLVDAPGYGYAITSKEKKKKFGLMIEDYIVNRKDLRQVFMLVDFRHRPTSDDIMMYDYLKYYKIPVTIIATKADKVGQSLHPKHKKIISKDLSLEEGDDIIVFSNVTKQGKENVLNKIESTL